MQHRALRDIGHSHCTSNTNHEGWINLSHQSKVKERLLLIGISATEQNYNISQIMQSLMIQCNLFLSHQIE